jgi:quercetin dioxygenase-like cupin family protein
MVFSHEAAKVTHPVPGVTRRILANSRNLMLTEHTLEKGAVLPDHHHLNEQLVYLLSGAIILEMDGVAVNMVTGDSLDIPPDVSHKVTALEKTVALDIFSPAREDYL